ncbi:hypothetical protein AAFF_G00279970 [Aldrovandia affinis]|uniref:Uncharacterized protein n=1 Tax=Aldrovandia affinis TaxID=143900 RepID=A0AAD7SRR0_9TELE|nr:hypothetical protein AAFF_G00279970 [Aldrovandia affinis]
MVTHHECQKKHGGASSSSGCSGFGQRLFRWCSWGLAVPLADPCKGQEDRVRAEEGCPDIRLAVPFGVRLGTSLLWTVADCARVRHVRHFESLYEECLCTRTETTNREHTEIYCDSLYEQYIAENMETLSKKNKSKG